MKPKKLNKKLSLAKKNISNLNNDELRNVHGAGEDPSYPATYCASCWVMTCEATCPFTCGSTCNTC
jgi:hypothetical protein